MVCLKALNREGDLGNHPNFTARKFSPSPMWVSRCCLVCGRIAASPPHTTTLDTETSASNVHLLGLGLDVAQT